MSLTNQDGLYPEQAFLYIVLMLGSSPLFWAIANDDPSVVQLLLQNGAEVQISDKNHLTPLHGTASCFCILSLTTGRSCREKLREMPVDAVGA